MMAGKQAEHQRTKRLLAKVSNGCFPIELCVFVIFGEFYKHKCSMHAGCYYILMKLSMLWTILFPLHRLFYMHISQKVRYRANHAVPSNLPTEVSRH